MKIGIIGGGFMGEAIIKGMLNTNQFKPNDISVIEIDTEKINQLKKYNIQVHHRLDLLNNEKVVILAVKPQQVEQVLSDLSKNISPKTIVISIAAGTTIATIEQKINNHPVIRVMPNILAAIGLGVSVYTTSKQVSTEDIAITEAILQSFSKVVIEVSDEKTLDAATAIHGSGPAYVFLFMEYIIQSAIKLGINKKDAEQLVLATFLGSADYALQSQESLNKLRESVTSPGGTTEAALTKLDDKQLDEIIDSAIHAAFDRATELANN
ncbi:MAG: pyrroline-5-carboxylate reductase [Dehalococcoidia bacterium]|nr:pyrroline-5-carboxylate reductase [Dehalococcoidia bacterium]